MGFQYPAQTPPGYQVSTPHYSFTALSPPSFPSLPGPSVFSEDSLAVYSYARRWTSNDILNRFRPQLITFDMLPDDVLLEIFDFYLDEDMGKAFEEQRNQEWITLAHVCQRWRSVVFQSPQRLHLRLVCPSRTRSRDTLDIWPPLPLIVQDTNRGLILDNIIAALEHNDRVCQIKLIYLSNSQIGYVTDSAAMRKPFPDLTDVRLRVDAYDEPQPVLPDSSWGGTAPSLRSLYLHGVSFPGIRKILLSATGLVKLDLRYIPRSGYIPPEVMATSLSALTSLESLRLHFRHPRPRPSLETQRPPPRPLTRSILPSLTKIEFKGASEYLEEILARIDAPRLDELHIVFFNQVIFDTPQLFQFINRRPTLRALEKGHIAFNSKAIFIGFPSQTSDRAVLTMQVPCTTSEWQLSSLEQVCTSLPPVSTLEDLYILESPTWRPRWQDDVESMLWLDLLHPFVAVKNLYLSNELVPRIAPALQELVGGRAREVLPTLDKIFLMGLRRRPRSLHEGIEKFFAERQHTSHPVFVFRYRGNLERGSYYWRRYGR